MIPILLKIVTLKYFKDGPTSNLFCVSCLQDVRMIMLMIIKTENTGDITDDPNNSQMLPMTSMIYVVSKICYAP